MIYRWKAYDFEIADFEYHHDRTRRIEIKRNYIISRRVVYKKAYDISRKRITP